MEHAFPKYLCLTDLLDQDLSAYEYFQTLSPEIQDVLRKIDDSIGSLEELQSHVAHLHTSRQMQSSPDLRL